LPDSYLGYSIKEFVEPSAIASPQVILSPILAASLPSIKVLLAPADGALVASA
jgi:hypothetical protein